MNSLKLVTSRSAALLLDVDGCLVLADRPGGEGGQVLRGATDLLDRLCGTGRPYLLFTNASSLPPDDYAAALRDHERAAAVLVGSDAEFGQRKLDAACRAVGRGAELLVTSDSRWFAGRNGPQVGVAGAIAAGISYVTGVEAQVMGKPSALAMREVLRRLEVDPRDLLVVGDDPNLEIVMGKRAGCRTCWCSRG